VLFYVRGNFGSRKGVEPGSFTIYAGTREDAVQEVESLIRKEVDRVTSKGIRKDEFERSRSQLIADFEMGLQDNQGTAMQCVLDELYGLGFTRAFDTRQRLEALTIEDVQRAAASILSAKKMAISIVMPENKKRAEAGSDAEDDK